MEEEVTIPPVPLVKEEIRVEIEKVLREMNERLMRKTEELFNKNMKAPLRIRELALRIGNYGIITDKEPIRSISGRIVDYKQVDRVYNTLYLTITKGILFKQDFFIRAIPEDQGPGSFDYVVLECLSKIMRNGLSKMIAKIELTLPEELI